MSTENPTWIVLTRDVTGTVTVTDQPRVTVALILDADTGLVRGVSLGDTVWQACSGAARTALSTPAGPLPPRPPTQVFYDEAQTEGILTALTETLPHLPAAAFVAGAPPAEAEDVFDSLIGHLTGSQQPAAPPRPADWAQLYAGTAAYFRAQPWHLWSDTDRLDLTTEAEGESLRSVVIVYGGQGIQRGLAALPVPQLRDRPSSRDLPAPASLPSPPSSPIEGPAAATPLRASCRWTVTCPGATRSAIRGGRTWFSPQLRPGRLHPGRPRPGRLHPGRPRPRCGRRGCG